MRKLAYIISIVAIVSAFGDSGVIFPEGWETLAGTQNNMSLYAVVEDLDGRRVETAGSALAVFDARGVCCGVAEVESEPNGNLVFQPGKGYMLRQAISGTVDFRNAEENKAQ